MLAIACLATWSVFPGQAVAQSGERTKSAYNVTQGRDGESVDARSGDVIEYTLQYRNTAGTTQTVVVEDNLSDVLLLADMYDYNGATLNGSLLQFPAVTLSPNATVTRTFRVRVKTIYSSTQDLLMSNYYGNSVDIYVESSTDSTDRGVRSKSAYNQTQSRDAESVTARIGDIIEYRLRYYNDTSSTKTITIEDDISDILKNAEMVRISNDGDWLGSSVRWSNIVIGSHSSVERTFEVRVRDFSDRDLRESDQAMINFYGEEVRVRVDNYSYGSGGTASGNKSKTAFNRTQGASAVSVYARPGDLIDYSLYYRNDSGYTQNIAIEDDLTDVLDLSDLVNSGGGVLYNKTLRFENITLSPGSSVSKTFQVRVKNISQDKQDKVMSNYYGNGVDITVLPSSSVVPPGGVPPKGQVKGTTYVAPATGPEDNLPLIFALLFTSAMLVYNKRNRLALLINQ